MMKNLDLKVIAEHGGQLLKYVIPVAVILTVVGVCYFAGVALLYYVHDKRLEKQSVLLKVLPKGGVDIKETEQLIKNLHSMLLNTKFRKIKYGRPFMSFELAAKQGKMNFYIKVPVDMKDRIVDRIYATYKDIAIEIVEDYIPDDKQPYYTSELVLGLHHTLKIRTKAQQDIINSILSGMKDLGKNDFNGVQIILRPIDNSWQIKGRRELARFERDGKRPGEKDGMGGKLSNLRDSLSSQVDEMLKHEGIRVNIFNGERSSRKTRLERREIVVASEKLTEPGFEVVIRIVAMGKYRKGNTARVKAISAAFNELDAENRFKKDLVLNQGYLLSQYRNRSPHYQDKSNILTPSELANFFLRLPGEELLEKFGEIEKVAIKEFEAPPETESSGKGVVFAKNTYKGNEKVVEIKDKDIVRHVVIQGKTGSGKSEWMKTAFLDHIKKGRGAMVLEPHGKLADELLEIIPEDRRKDVIVFDLFSDHPWPFNFCKVPDRENGILNQEQLMQKTLDEAIEIFKRAFSDVWSEKNEFYITNAIKAIMETGHTMVELPRMFSDKKFRDSIIPKLKDPKVKKFWIDKFKTNAQGKIDAATESTAQSVEYKLEKFLNSKELVRALGQDDCIDFKEILDNNKIIIFKFSKDRMSKDRITFLGGIAMKLLIVGAFARDKSMWNIPFTVWIDEAQNFINESIKDVLYELRKYGIGLILMHQELEQMKEVPGLINAIYNNVGTSITFTVGDMDAPFFANKYGPRVDADDLKDLPSRYGYCRLLVNGHTTDTFNIYSLDRPEASTAEDAANSVREILEYNKKGKMSIDEIDEMIAERFAGEDVVFDEEEQQFAVELNDADDENEGFIVKDQDHRDLEDNDNCVEEVDDEELMDTFKTKNTEDKSNIKKSCCNEDSMDTGKGFFKEPIKCVEEQEDEELLDIFKVKKTEDKNNTKKSCWD